MGLFQYKPDGGCGGCHARGGGNAQKKANLAVFVSGGGTNLQTILDALDARTLRRVRLALVLASTSKAYALERAKKAGVPYEVVLEKQAGGQVGDFATRLLNTLAFYEIDLIFLGGYLKKIPQEVVQKYAGRIANIHPTLLPKYGGPGMYGLAPHEAVLAAKEPMTGATVHYVNENFDDGDILLQKEVPVMAGDTPPILQARVMKEGEHVIVPQAIQLMADRFLGLENKEES